MGSYRAQFRPCVTRHVNSACLFFLVADATRMAPGFVVRYARLFHRNCGYLCANANGLAAPVPDPSAIKMRERLAGIKANATACQIHAEACDRSSAYALDAQVKCLRLGMETVPDAALLRIGARITVSGIDDERPLHSEALQPAVHAARNVQRNQVELHGNIALHVPQDMAQRVVPDGVRAGQCSTAACDQP